MTCLKNIYLVNIVTWDIVESSPFVSGIDWDSLGSLDPPPPYLEATWPWSWVEGGAGGVATGRPIVLGGPAKELGRISLPVWELLGSWAGRERLPGGWADLEVTGVMLPWNRS